jgi:hypothetical protein
MNREELIAHKKLEAAQAYEASRIAKETAEQNKAAINAIRGAIANTPDGQKTLDKLAILEVLTQQQPELDRAAVEYGQRFEQISQELARMHATGPKVSD